MTFRLLDVSTPEDLNARQHQRALLASRKPPEAISSHRAAAPLFQPGPALAMAVNVALSVGAPLLLTGEPGTGKTQVAHYLAWYFNIEDQLYQLDVRSNTTAGDLLYHFDSVAYFHAAHDPERRGHLDRSVFVRKGPLWRALESGQPSILLLDEIDKASRDFPNDLLGVLDQSRFYVPESETWVERRSGVAPPIWIITSNSERRLPEPFLRRCVFHHIELTEDLLRKAVAARRARDFPGLTDATVEAALVRMMELRGKALRKRPATAELLVWLAVLGAQGIDAAVVQEAPLRALPGIEVLVKDRDDMALL